MPDNKLTDVEIKKALECCIKEDYSCKDCWYDCDKHLNKKTLEFDSMPNGMSYDQLSCDEWLKKDALDLINRLQAENERLCAEIDELIIAKDLLFDEAEALIKKAKAEAYKEFAEKVTDRISDAIEQSDNNPDGNTYFITDVFETIDNLLKELVGEDK